MSDLAKIAYGVYRIENSADSDGQPYTLHQHSDGWLIRDSRRRSVSVHPTKEDAAASVEVRP